MPVRPGLREAISSIYGTIGPDDVLVHAEAEEAVFTLMNDVLSPGDEK